MACSWTKRARETKSKRFWAVKTEQRSLCTEHLILPTGQHLPHAVRLSPHPCLLITSSLPLLLLLLMMLLLLLLIKIQPINQNLGIQMEHIRSIVEQAAESDERGIDPPIDRYVPALFRSLGA
jgi:hypothetical protein